jgi:hypothetical protein
LNQLPIDVLKELLVEFNMPQEGNKKEVVERLWAVAMPAHKVMQDAVKNRKNYKGNFPLGLRKGERGLELEGGVNKFEVVDHSPDADERPPAPTAEAEAAIPATGLTSSSSLWAADEGLTRRERIDAMVRIRFHLPW